MNWKYFPLHPDTPNEGMTLDELFKGRLSAEQIAATQEKLRNLMAEEGLPWGNRNMTYNSRLAQELAKWADETQDSEALHVALYQAYFAEGKNIGDPEVLFGIVEQVGLPVEEARTALENRQFQKAVDQDWQAAHQYQINGVPTFIADQYMMSGAQPYEQIAGLLEHVGTAKL